MPSAYHRTPPVYNQKLNLRVLRLQSQLGPHQQHNIYADIQTRCNNTPLEFVHVKLRGKISQIEKKNQITEQKTGVWKKH